MSKHTAELRELLQIMRLGLPEIRTIAVNGEPTEVVNEAGVYVLIFESPAAKAREFRDWVRTQLLPLARADGRPEQLKNQVKARLVAVLGGSVNGADWFRT